MGVLLGLVMSVLLWVAAQPAQAQTVDECQAEIAALRTQTENTTFIGQNADKDEAGLIGKLDSASAKLSQGKFLDARANLQSFRAKVEALDQQGKIAHEDAVALIAGADEAIACVAGPHSTRKVLPERSSQVHRQVSGRFRGRGFSKPGL